MSEDKDKAWSEFANEIAPYENTQQLSDAGRGAAAKLGFYRGFDAGRASRDGLRSQLRSNNTVLFDVASLVGAGKYFDAIELCHAKVFGNNQALEDDGEGR